MIAVTSGVAVAADAPPSAASNSVLAAPAGTEAPAAPSQSPAAAPESPSPPAAAVTPGLPVAPQPAALAAPAVDLTAPQPAAPANQSITGKWWFWTAIGAAVVAGVVAIYFVERTPAPPGCPTTMGYVCPR